MMNLLVCLALTATPAGGTTPAQPSVAVLGLAAKQGVHADVAELLTDNLVESLRRSHRFSRVTSASEVQAALNFEAQKQLAKCDSTSCLAEIAGALGVDYIVTGSLGRLGETWLFNARLIHVATGVAEGSVSSPIEGPNEAILLKAVDGIMDAMLASSRVRAADVSAAPASPPPVVAVPTPAPPADQAARLATARRGPSVGAILAGTVGALGLLGAAVSLLAAAGGASAAGLNYALFNYVPGFAAYQQPMQTAIFVGLGTAALGGLVFLAMAAIGAGGVVLVFIVS